MSYEPGPGPFPDLAGYEQPSLRRDGGEWNENSLSVCRLRVPPMTMMAANESPLTLDERGGAERAVIQHVSASLTAIMP